MKKQIVFLSLLAIMLSSTMVAQTVFVTKTGKKYHAENCEHLSKSSIAISLSDAKAKGYTACMNCVVKPDTKNPTIDSTAINPKKEEPIETVKPN